MADRGAHPLLGLGGRLLAALIPPRCVCCRELVAPPPEPRALGPPPPVLCARCEHRLPRSRGRLPAGTGLGWLVVPLSYEAAGRELVAALKFRRLTAVAGLAADLICAELPPLAAETCLVPVPAAPRRRRARGFDSAELICAALAERLGLPAAGVLRRVDAGHQRGRGRAERLRRPPRFEALARLSLPAVIVDDVVTTGATIGACAAALELAGMRPPGAVALAQTPPRGIRRLN